MNFPKTMFQIGLMALLSSPVMSQNWDKVSFLKDPLQKQIKIFMGGRLFTQFLFPDTLEKPVLFPIFTSSELMVTRGFPLIKQSGDATDHPHHIGLWLNYENVNGLDFWNNSSAIAASKKSGYGWIRTDRFQFKNQGNKGILTYHANWTDQEKHILVEENTHFEFSGYPGIRIIDRITTLKALKKVLFKDAKDGFLGLRLAHALQIPILEDQKFTDEKGIVTLVKGGRDPIPTGNYYTSEGKMGNDAWSTRGNWCKAFGKIGPDSVSIIIIDHPKNSNYPTFWHARGYGLFAANPLGEKIFTQGKSEKNLALEVGESVTFRYRIIIQNGIYTLNKRDIESFVKNFDPDLSK